MQVYVTANLTGSDEFNMTSAQAAEAVLAALGGDPTKDLCTFQATIPPAQAGVSPNLPGTIPSDMKIPDVRSDVTDG